MYCMAFKNQRQALYAKLLLQKEIVYKNSNRLCMIKKLNYTNVRTNN